MTKITKRMHFISKKINFFKKYDVKEALVLLREVSITKFIESVDVAVNLGIDARKSDHNIRGTAILPYGTGRNIRVAVFTQNNNFQLAKDAGADLIGMDDLANKIKNGEFNFDIVIASPDVMHIVSKLGQILGPRGLMPNPKTGTITSNIEEAIKNAKNGQVIYHNDKNGIIHSTIGKINFEYYKLKENLEFLLSSLIKSKLPQIKGTYIKKINLSTTMGPGMTIDQSSLSIKII